VIAVDTNVLVRLVLGDDPRQVRAAQRLMLQARRSGESVYVADAVLCELVWVLRSRYKLNRAACASALEALLDVELIEVDGAAGLESAVRAYAAGRGDFADYLIRERSRAAGATEVVTFDRALKGEQGFRVVG